jgi:enamine deaminase RidA (YjgF/YER057c/UK114 family)
LLFIAGQIAMDRAGNVLAAGDIVGQFAAAISNFTKVLKAGGARPEDVLKITLFVRDVADYQKRSREIGALYREVFGKHYPAMTMVQIACLVREECLIEIEGIAAI